MDLTAWLIRRAPPRPLIVTAAGGTEARVAVERIAREAGWPVAVSPAEANILVVAGPIGSELQQHADALWAQVPAPRVRVVADSGSAATELLGTAVTSLRNVEQQRQQATSASDDSPGTGACAQHENGEHHDGTGAEHEHDMGGMEMPGGITMAERADDRDGLKLDQLHVPLGPLLPDWPAGLLVRMALQGDIVQEATVEAVGLGDVAAGPFWNTAPPAARRLDACARLLSVAGWPDASTMARRLRDDVLGDRRTGIAERSMARWARRVRRSRTLRWLLAGVGATPAASTTPPALAGDALARLDRWIDSATHSVDQPHDEADTPREARWILDNLPALLEGSELANARLLVASLDPDLEALVGHEVGHG